MRKIEMIMEEIDDAIKDYSGGSADNAFRGFVKGLKRAKKIIQKHMNDEWIPCSERMPEEKGKYLVQFRETRCIHIVGYGFCREDVLGNQIGFGWYDTYSATYFDKNAIEYWRPLPEPHKPLAESEDSKRMREREECFKDGEEI